MCIVVLLSTFAISAEALPHITIDKELGEIRIEGQTSSLHWSGAILEFFVLSGDDRAYESLVTTKASPLHIHAALMSLGFIPDKRETAQLIDCWIEYADENGKVETIRLERLAKSLRTKSASPDIPFAFTGSYMTENPHDREGPPVLAATITGAVIGLFDDPSAILTLPFSEPSPYSFSGVGFISETSQYPVCMTEDWMVKLDGKNLTPCKAPKEYPVTIILRRSKLPRPTGILQTNIDAADPSTQNDM